MTKYFLIVNVRNFVLSSLLVNSSFLPKYNNFLLSHKRDIHFDKGIGWHGFAYQQTNKSTFRTAKQVITFTQVHKCN